MSKFLIATDPIRMSLRARVYLGIVAVQCFVMGGFFLFEPSWFVSSSYDQIRDVAPLPVWSFAFLIAGAICAAAAHFMDEHVARYGLMLTAVLECIWVGGFIAAWFAGSLQSPLGPLVWGVLLARDLVILSQPLCTPFEDIIRRIEEKRPGA